jgi:UDP-N-acetylglucosamine--N-acetylmuramyl-(pentapeptide) pyrophosphoryl-undecaprenol N-acetylglucosamine transferase
MHVVVAGGGSAGHIEPALAFADALRRRFPDAEVTALGTERGLDTRIIPARGYELALIPPVPIPRRPGRDLLRVPGRLKAAVDAAADVLRRQRADVLVGFGGFVAGPAYLAARRLGVPYVVHEANPRAGWANRLGARFTPYVATTFPGTRIAHARQTGLPIRRVVATLDRPARRAEARAAYGLEPDRPTLLVTGGSQGARRLNEAAAGAADALRAAGVQVLHATGPGNVVEVPGRNGGSPPYVVLPYLERMELAYAAADLALCRAGANTVTEMTAVGLPAAYVPLPIGNGEQELIARPVVAAGGGLLVDDAACTPEWVAATLTPLLVDPQRLATMGAAAAGFGRRDGDERLVDLALEALGSGGGRAGKGGGTARRQA